MPDSLPRNLDAFLWAVVLWLIGFVWGSIVFSISLLKDLPSIPYVSKHPAISSVLLVLYLPLIIYLSRKVGTTLEGLKLGLTISVSNALLDLIVYYLIFNSSDYFDYLSVWVSYAMFLLVPFLQSKQYRL